MLDNLHLRTPPPKNLLPALVCALGVDPSGQL